jgi:hypothetical protein
MNYNQFTYFMKKLMLMFFVVALFVTASAKAQTDSVSVTVEQYCPGVNNLDTFSYYITSDGWLFYSLIDNGTGGTTSNYESCFSLKDDDTNAYLVGDGNSRPGGGNWTGSVNIGTSNRLLFIYHECGFIDGSTPVGGEGWALSVTFN